MQRHAISERHELSATLRRAGAHAPTLCGDWTTAELAAHLVLRERSLVELAGRLPVAPLRAKAERAIAQFVDREPYEQLVASFAAGPPALSPWSLPPVCEAVNLLEYVIHHEDVRRAGDAVAARALPVARQQAIWRRLRLAAPLTMRKVPIGVRLVWPGHGEFTTRLRSDAHVTVSGEPVELALLAFGRQQVAQLVYDGSAEDVARVSGARIAI